MNLPPTVEIIASKRVVRTGGKFNVRVIGGSTIDLRAVWWYGIRSGIAELDKAHWRTLNGERYRDELWADITINQEGIYTFGANSCDTRYGVELGAPPAEERRTSRGTQRITGMVSMGSDWEGCASWRRNRR